jgi:hypothetical protein
MPHAQGTSAAGKVPGLEAGLALYRAACRCCLAAGAAPVGAGDLKRVLAGELAEMIGSMERLRCDLGLQEGEGKEGRSQLLFAARRPALTRAVEAHAALLTALGVASDSSARPDLADARHAAGLVKEAVGALPALPRTRCQAAAARMHAAHRTAADAVREASVAAGVDACSGSLQLLRAATQALGDLAAAVAQVQADDSTTADLEGPLSSLVAAAEALCEPVDELASSLAFAWEGSDAEGMDDDEGSCDGSDGPADTVPGAEALASTLQGLALAQPRESLPEDPEEAAVAEALGALARAAAKVHRAAPQLLPEELAPLALGAGSG